MTNKHPELFYIGYGYCRTSINTCIFRQSSIASFRDQQYIAYYNAQGRVVLGVRNHGNREWRVTTTGFSSNMKDAHNVISIGIDGEGILHIAYGMHSKPLNYIRTKSPDSLELAEANYMDGIEEERVTYPEFYTLPSGDMLFVYRAGKSGNGNMVVKRYLLKEHRWETLHNNLIDGEGVRNAYWQMWIGQDDTVHLSWVWRETSNVATNHDICYARSDDGGYTWHKSDGTPYVLPVTQSSAEVAWKVPQNSELMNQTSMATDSDGRPYIATYWRDSESSIPQYRIIWHDGNEWEMRAVGERKSPFTLSGKGTKMVPISRPKILVDGKKVYILFRDKDRGSKVSIATIADINSGQWKITDLTEFSVDAWEPTIDVELWKREKQLDIFVQCTHQGDGEKESYCKQSSSPIFILEAQITRS